MGKSTKDTFGYLGTEPMALREQLNQLTAALEEVAKAEGAEAMKAASEAARRIAVQASQLADEFAGAAHAAAAAAGQGRSQLEGAIRDKPLMAGRKGRWSSRLTRSCARPSSTPLRSVHGPRSGRRTSSPTMEWSICGDSWKTTKCGRPIASPRKTFLASSM